MQQPAAVCFNPPCVCLGEFRHTHVVKGTAFAWCCLGSHRLAVSQSDKGHSDMVERVCLLLCWYAHALDVCDV